LSATAESGNRVPAGEIDSRQVSVRRRHAIAAWLAPDVHNQNHLW
jgi:hypothetical protein